MATVVLDQLRNLNRTHLRQIVGANYSTAGIRLSKDLLYVNRDHCIRSNGIDLDIHSRIWSVAFFSEDHGDSSLERLGGRIELRRKQILFIPFFSFLKWQLVAGQVCWEGFLCRQPASFKWQDPMLFPWNRDLPSLQTENEIITFVNGLSGGIPVGFKLKNSIVGEKVKQKLDACFPEAPTMLELAQDFGIAHPSLDREFKKTFGISPREYNVRQRTLATYLSSLFQQNTSIKSLASQMGFYHMGNFHKQCRRYLSARPSELKTIAL